MWDITGIPIQGFQLFSKIAEPVKAKLLQNNHKKGSHLVERNPSTHSNYSSNLWEYVIIYITCVAGIVGWKKVLLTE